MTPTTPPTLAPPPTVEPSATAEPTAPAGTGTGLRIEWTRHPSGFGREVDIRGSAVGDGRIVVIGSTFVDDETGHVHVPAIWWEDGDLVWRPAQLPPFEPWEDRLTSIVSGPKGLLVTGSYGLLWTSRDGRVWESAVDHGLPPEATIVVASDGLIARGWDDGEFSGALVSADGRQWRQASDAMTQGIMARADFFVGSGQQLTAFVYQDARVTVWRSSGIEAWSAVGDLPGSRGATIVGAAVGPRGWIALGDARGPIAWASRDGVTWELAENAPARVGPAFGVSAGFLTVGAYSTDTGCAVDPRSTRTDTWTSSDGRVWRLVDEITNGAEIVSLRRRGQTLIGIGMIGEEQGAVWTTRLPEESRDDGPAPTPAAAPFDPSHGCR